MTIKTSGDAFNEDLTEEEEKLLQEQSAAATPPANADVNEDPPAPVETPAAGETDPTGQPAAPAVDATAAGDEDAAANFEAFKAKHATRTPEELLQLAFQKEQARKTARFDAKEARQVVTELRDGMQRRLAESAQKREQERQRFSQTLQQDPDKAAQEAFERVQNKEAEEEQQREWRTYVDTQTHISRSVIPEFDNVAPELMQFGVERMGYDPQQVAAAHDARDIITLYFASRFDKLVQSGVVDMQGRILNGGAAPVTAPQGGGQPAARSAPRQPPLTMSSAPGGAGSGSRSLKDQAQDILTMSEQDFEKAVDSGLFDQTLRGLAGGRS